MQQGQKRSCHTLRFVVVVGLVVFVADIVGLAGIEPVGNSRHLPGHGTAV